MRIFVVFVVIRLIHVTISVVTADVILTIRRGGSVMTTEYPYVAGYNPAAQSCSTVLQHTPGGLQSEATTCRALRDGDAGDVFFKSLYNEVITTGVVNPITKKLIHNPDDVTVYLDGQDFTLTDACRR